MKKTISAYDFEREFKNYGRKDSFSYEGLISLFNYLEEYEKDSGEEIELDIIQICCDYSEYENLKDFNNQNNTNFETIEEIEDYTIVIKINDESFIAQNY